MVLMEDEVSVERGEHKRAAIKEAMAHESIEEKVAAEVLFLLSS